ncbi:hypothetical protein ACQPZK_24195 [Micromonospora sp. CA-249363]|uniref:hypothetical protein n=1 Tax=Micromonospora sp. CA-249363 TaxID=3239963 RepID=UPI003D91ADB4
MTTTRTATPQKVHAWQRVLVVTALLASVAILGWSYLTRGDTIAFRFTWIPVALTVVPLLLARRRQFTYACLVVGGLLLVLACGPVPDGILPAVLVLLATTADPRWSPWRAGLSVLVGAALVVVPVVASAGAVRDSLTAPQVGFVVHRSASAGFTDLVEPGGPSVRGVQTVRGSGGEGPISFVEFEPGLSADGQDQLRRRLEQAPGVTRVCSWYRNNHLRSAC